MVKALETPETSFTNLATCSGPEANMAKNAPIICSKGAPGGCPTCNFAEVAMYSPASQKLTVGSTVIAYVMRAIKKTDHPRRVSHFSKFFKNMKYEVYLWGRIY